MKKLIIALFGLFLVSCEGARVMTLVELPETWSDKDGQAFLEKIDMRKLQYSVFKKFPDAQANQIHIRIMPLVFKPAGDKEQYYRFEIIVDSPTNWTKTGLVQSYIADYLTRLLEKPE